MEELAALHTRLAPGGTAGAAYGVPTIEEIETEILLRLTPAKKLAVMHALWRQAWELKLAGVRRQHAEWTTEQAQARVREIFRGADA